MRTAQAPKRATVSRRDFLRASMATAGTGLALASAGRGQAAPPRETSCIFLLLTGGPSQLDTWDPKPDAPAEVRGPFAAIDTSVAGTRISEHFPLMAAQAHRYAIVRSVHHTAAPIHETGLQLVQTGRLSQCDAEHPHVAAVLAHLLGPRRPGVARFVILPEPIGDTGVSVCRGQGAGFLVPAHVPGVLNSPLQRVTEDAGARERYGPTAFGDHCLQARRLIEAGVRCVIVNMFTALFDRVTWDCHADRRFLPGTLDDYRRLLCPTFDRAYAALIDDLHQRGLLESTLVIAAGEFGRTPRLNRAGGRDHWPGVWSVLFAGGGVRGGRIVGASDKYGAEPSRRPVPAQDIAATIYRAFAVDPATRLTGPRGQRLTLTDGRPIVELFS